MPDGSVKDVPLSELAVSDHVLIKPGEKIPADGVIVAGESLVNAAMLTGDSTPTAKKSGGTVIGGAINGEGSLTIEVKSTGKDSFLSQVIDLVKQAKESKSKTQDLANTAALWLTIVALGGGVITFLIWQVLMGQDFAFAIERAVTVMVIACPHALGLAVPLVVAVSTALGAKHGLLIRNRVAFESARKLQAIIFDKTGTLTEGPFGVTDTLILSRISAKACYARTRLPWTRIPSTPRQGDRRPAFFSLFPLIVLFVTVASVFIDRDRAGNEIIAYVETYIPIGGEKQSYIFDTIAGVVKARGQAGTVAFLMLV